MPFESGLVVEEVADGLWKLSADLVYAGKREEFTIPAGFQTDFASVPRLFTWLVPTSGRYTKAAVVHDWLLEEKRVSRCDADGIFRRIMRELGVPVVRRWVMWSAVRLAGALHPCGYWQILLAVLFAVAISPLAAPGAVIVVTALSLLWAVECGTWAVLKLVGAKPGSPRRFWWV